MRLSKSSVSPRLAAVLLAGALFLISSLTTGVEQAGQSAPAAERSGGEAGAPRVTVDELLATTYLGHAAELPDSTEPVEVLLAYLEGRGHRGRPRIAELNRGVAQWKRFVRRHPDSRYAAHGLALLLRERAALNGDRRDLERAADALAAAARRGLASNRLLYTRDLSEVLADLGDVGAVDRIFGELMAVAPLARRAEHYVALIDYADALARLGDERAWSLFEDAIALNPDNPIEATNRYSGHLLSRGRPAQAAAVLARLTSEERVRFVQPARLYRQALASAGESTEPADRELARVEAIFPEVSLALPAADPAAAGGVEAATAAFAHSNSTDDCRHSSYAASLHCDANGFCLRSYVVNLAEVLYNEARGEGYGGQDMVGWTVRDRAFQGVSCDVYVGGVNYTTCRSNLPCGDPDRCSVSRNYCCVIHGGTTTVGATHYQFNDAHQTLQNLINAGTFYEASYIWRGWIPDPSTNFVPSGVGSCSFGCAGFCSTGTNYTSPSPFGPMEFLGYNYCAQRQDCKTYKKNVCGQNAVPASCTTGGNAGDNHFWNRKN